MTLISEQGAGSCFSFLIQDMGDFENLRDNEDLELGCVQTKMGEFNSAYNTENKFLKKEERLPQFSLGPDPTMMMTMTFKSKSPKNYSCINPQPPKNVDGLLRNNSLKNPADENDNRTNKYSFNEFSKNEERTFTLTPSVMDPEGDPIMMDNARLEENRRRASNNLPIPLPRHSVSTSRGFSGIGDIKLKDNIENNISSISCSKMGSDMVWSFSSDSNIWKEISDFSIFEDKLRQIKEINKFKKCPCSDMLVVDHDEMSNYAIKLILTSLGFLVESCSMSHLAVDSVSKKLDSECCKIFKMIFISNDLPSISGHETCKQIKKIYSELNMIIPALITLANKINEVEQEEIRQAGFSDFICKPIMQNTIHFYIKKYMSVDLVKKKIYIVQN